MFSTPRVKNQAKLYSALYKAAGIIMILFLIPAALAAIKKDWTQFRTPVTVDDIIVETVTVPKNTYDVSYDKGLVIDGYHVEMEKKDYDEKFKNGAYLNTEIYKTIFRIERSGLINLIASDTFTVARFPVLGQAPLSPEEIETYKVTAAELLNASRMPSSLLSQNIQPPFQTKYGRD